MVMAITTVMGVGGVLREGKLSQKRERMDEPATCVAARIGLNRSRRQIMIDL
jgi:hypothetical protein